MALDITSVPAVGGDAPGSVLCASEYVTMAGGMPYEDPTLDKHCTGLKANGDRCGAPKAKGTQLCIGHLRSASKGA